MGLDIWFPEDLERILLGIDEVNLDAVSRCPDEPEVRIYRLGFAAAIRAVATAFGVPFPNVRVPTFTIIADEPILLPFQPILDK